MCVRDLLPLHLRGQERQRPAAAELPRFPALRRERQRVRVFGSGEAGHLRHHGRVPDLFVEEFHHRAADAGEFEAGPVAVGGAHIQYCVRLRHAELQYRPVRVQLVRLQPVRDRAFAEEVGVRAAAVRHLQRGQLLRQRPHGGAGAGGVVLSVRVDLPVRRDQGDPRAADRDFQGVQREPVRGREAAHVPVFDRPLRQVRLQHSGDALHFVLRDHSVLLLHVFIARVPGGLVHRGDAGGTLPFTKRGGEVVGHPARVRG
mmetsp:Transcript_18771/g.46946  ORF Transcript_18771/g.46946 Transcript_18771/m.46946 type:complete len:259 (+) Transcript_18771:858-1634(+)